MRPVSGRAEPSRPLELLLTVDRGEARTLGEQIEIQLRRAIQQGQLRAGGRLPSTRDLARQLSVSRRVTVDAYSQLAAEGYLIVQQGAHPRVADGVQRSPSPSAPLTPLASAPPPRFDFRPARPDVSTFPRRAWARCLREAVTTISDAELIYGDPCGVDELRITLAEYLGRARGVAADPVQVVVTSGYIQGLGIICRALRATGARRIALEDPSAPEQGPVARRAGLEPVFVPVDEEGLRVDMLEAANVDAVVVTPAHQHPTGVVLSPYRRAALRDWLRVADAIAVEDDYDAEYRYDRAAVGALQGVEPERIVYCGSASKTLAPALRMGWLVVPARLHAAVAEEKFLADQGTARIEQHALAAFISRGELDRHLRRMRLRYRARRDALMIALGDAVPGASVHGIAAGLHLNVRLSERHDEQRLRDAAAERRLELSTLSDYRAGAFDDDPVLLLGYSRLNEASIPRAVEELAFVLDSSRLDIVPDPVAEKLR